MSHVIRQTSSLAVISLVTGILGWTVIPVLGSVIAVVFGHMARAEVRRNPHTLEGDGLAVAGLVLGWVMLGAIALAIIVAVLVSVLFFGGIAWLVSLQP